MIPEHIIKQVESKCNTRRCIYQTLVNLGYSLREIAIQYNVNHRTVWERTHDIKYNPKEESQEKNILGKLR